MPNERIAELWLFAGIMALSLVSGMLSGKMLECLLLGLLAYLAWHLFQLARLPRLLNTRLPPWKHHPPGLWRAVYREIDALHSSASQHEAALSRSRQRFHDAVSALPIAVVMLEQDGRVDWLNPAAGQLLNIDIARTSGQMFQDLVRDPVLEEYMEKSAFEQPLVFSPPANRSKIVSLLVTALGQHKHMIIASDITRQYHLDSEQLDFVANMSHELRTPLTVITGLLEQIQAVEDDTLQNRRSFELMQRQAVRMNELISDLLTLTRLDLDKQEPAHEEINVLELMTTIADDATAMGKASGHEIQLEIEPSASLWGDRKDLRTAFSNLVINAIQHTPDRTQVRVDWHVDATGSHLCVSDNGEGIASRHLPRLTEHLYRVDSSRSRNTGGTGLGLAIVKYILERHGASLDISSKEGRGSTFCCRFTVTGEPETVPHVTNHLPGRR